MTESILFNVHHGLKASDIDQINNKFYSRFNYPWAPLVLPAFEDPEFYARALNNDLGLYNRPRLPANMSIWVAGCGTNQAILTALKYPNATVVGTDISEGSLLACQRVIDQIGLTNVTLRRSSLNEEMFLKQFDYVICTGVIHHNSEPMIPLKNLSRALKPNGILELMVYNFYHRIQTTACQKAIQIMSGSREGSDLDRELYLSRQLVESFSADSEMGKFLQLFRDKPEAAIADALFQPMEYSYTVASLNELAADCGLQLMTYCANQFDRVLGRIEWELPLEEGPLRDSYDPLNDIDRWQVTNLIMGEKSPLLWFYLQSRGDGHERIDEHQLVESFLDTSFVPDRSSVRNYILDNAGGYKLLPTRNIFPAPAQPTDKNAAAVFRGCDGKSTIRDILLRLDMPLDFREVNRLRLHLATTAYPYLRAVDLCRSVTLPN